MKTVLIFAYECAPYNRPGSTIGAQRPYQFAKYLPEFGWRCVVITSDYERRRSIDKKDLDALREEIRERISENRGEMTVTIAIPSLKYADYPDRYWWKYTGTDPGSGAHFTRGGALAGLVRKVITLSKLLRGDHSQSWQACARVAAEEWMEAEGADVVIGEHSPDAGMYLAEWMHRRFGLPWIVDFRDPVERNLKFSVRKVYLKMIKRLLSTSSALVQVTPYWVELDQERFDKRTYYIPNGYDDSEFERKAPDAADGAFRIVYLGNIQKTQTITPFFEGLAEYIKENNCSPVEIQFIYRGNYFNSVASEAEELGIGDFVDSRGFIPRSEAIELMQRSDLMLLLSIDTSLVRDPLLKHGVYPGKVFELFAVSKPILSVPGDGGVLDDLIRETNTGEICKTADDVCDVIGRYVKEKQKWGTTALKSNDRVLKYSRRETAKTLSKVLSDLVEKGFDQ